MFAQVIEHHAGGIGNGKERDGPGRAGSIRRRRGGGGECGRLRPGGSDRGGGAAGQYGERGDAARADSPVRYSAFDPRLQLWVAACLYRGGLDVHTRLHGPLDQATADAIYRECRRCPRRRRGSRSTPACRNCACG
jgi:hypothetical protein